MNTDLQALVAGVQENCDIADARHGSDFTLCIYLMKMREYYRWEQGYAFSDPLSREQVGNWLQNRETRWEELEEHDFMPLSIAGQEYDPLSADQVNTHLLDCGVVYGGGLGHAGRPHFFLGELIACEKTENYSLIVSGREWARDLAAPPAMSLDNTIYIRRESLKRMLWERLENWRWSSADNAMGRALACYDFKDRLDESLEQMTDVETNAVLWHEMGEIQAGERFGQAWLDMLQNTLGTPAELMARAVRDHLADCLVTLPRLLQNGEPASIHFYIGNLSNMRKSIFPLLTDRYQQWRQSGDLGLIEEAVQKGREHWRETGEGILDMADRERIGFSQKLADYVSDRHLGS